MFGKNKEIQEDDYDMEPLTIGGTVSRCAICGGEPTFRNRWGNAFAKCMICGNGFEIFKNDFEKPKALPTDKKYEMVAMWNAKQIANATFLKSNDWVRDTGFDFSKAPSDAEIMKGLRAIRVDISDSRTEIINAVNSARNTVSGKVESTGKDVISETVCAVRAGTSDIICAVADDLPDIIRPRAPENNSRLEDFDAPAVSEEKPLVTESLTITFDGDGTATVSESEPVSEPVSESKPEPEPEPEPAAEPAEEEPVPESEPAPESVKEDSDPVPEPRVEIDGKYYDLGEDGKPIGIESKGVPEEPSADESRLAMLELIARRSASNPAASDIAPAQEPAPEPVREVNPDAPDSVPAVSEPNVITEGDDWGDEVADGKADEPVADGGVISEPAVELTEVKEEEVIIPVGKADESEPVSEPEPVKDDEPVEKEEPVAEAPKQQTPANPLEGLSLDQIQSYLKDLLEKKSN